MKKLLLITALLLCCLLAVSCQDSDSGKNAPSTGNSGDPDFDNVTPDEEFEYPENARKYVVKYIRDMAMTPWTPYETFGLYGKYQSWSYNLTYEKGNKYYGPPFLTDSRGTMQEFQNSIENGVYVGPTDSDCIGSACYDAVYVTLIQVCPSITFKSTADMLPGNNTGLLAVGDWDTSVSKYDTKDIINAHTITEMSKSYAKLTPGDVVLKHLVSQDAGHTRIVSGGPVIYYNNDGSINYNKSYITCIEQTNAWDKTVSHHSTWWVDHPYTFEELYKNNFVPLTPVDYTKDVSRAAITVDDLITADGFYKARKLKGEISSNHYITEVRVTLTNSEGKTIYERAEYPNAKKYDLNKMKYKPGLYEYEAGTYHCKIEAGLSFGTKTLADFDFVID